MHPPTAAATDALRGLTAAGVMLSAVVHLDQYAQGFSGIAVIGPLFLVNTVCGLLLGVTVLVWRGWVPALLCAGFGAVTVAAYWISVLHGLFGIREVTGGWPEIMAETAEYAAVVCGLAVAGVLLHEARRHRTAGAGRRLVRARTP